MSTRWAEYEPTSCKQITLIDRVALAIPWILLKFSPFLSLNSQHLQLWKLQPCYNYHIKSLLPNQIKCLGLRSVNLVPALIIGTEFSSSVTRSIKTWSISIRVFSFTASSSEWVSKTCHVTSGIFEFCFLTLLAEETSPEDILAYFFPHNDNLFFSSNIILGRCARDAKAMEDKSKSLKVLNWQQKSTIFLDPSNIGRKLDVQKKAWIIFTLWEWYQQNLKLSVIDINSADVRPVLRPCQAYSHFKRSSRISPHHFLANHPGLAWGDLPFHSIAWRPLRLSLLRLLRLSSCLMFLGSTELPWT